MWPALPGVGVGGLLFAPGSLPMGPLSTAISEYLLLPKIPTTQEPLLTLLLIKQLVSEFNPIFTPGEIEGTRSSRQPGGQLAGFLSLLECQGSLRPEISSTYLDICLLFLAE